MVAHRHSATRAPARSIRTRSAALAAALALAVAGCTADPGGQAPETGTDPGPQETPTETDAAPAFFKPGDTLELHLPFGEGGGTDTLARLVAPFLADVLDINVQVLNQPGGGGILGTNEYVLRTPADGYSMLMTSSSTQIPPVIHGAGVEYAFSDLYPVAGFPSGIIMFSHADSDFQHPRDLTSPHQRSQVTYAGQPPSGTELRYLLMFEMFGTDVNAVLGHDGSGSTRIAWERGESDVNFDSPTSYFEHVAPMVEAGTAIPLLTLGVFDGRELIRDPAWPDLPHVGEVYEEVFGQPITSEGLVWEAYELLALATVPLNKAFTMHPHAPAEAIAHLEWAFEQLSHDPDFIAAMDAELGGYQVMIDDEVHRAWQALTELTETESGGREWLLDWASEEFGVDLRG